MIHSKHLPRVGWPSLGALVLAALFGATSVAAEEDAPEVSLEKTPVFSEEQRQTLRDAREDQIRETLGLSDDAELPSRGDLTTEQRDLLADARADSVRELLDLPDDFELPDRPRHRRDSYRPNRPNRPDRPDRPDHGDRPERPERPERPDRPERPEHPNRPDAPSAA